MMMEAMMEAMIKQLGDHSFATAERCILVLEVPERLDMACMVAMFLVLMLFGIPCCLDFLPRLGCCKGF